MKHLKMQIPLLIVVYLAAAFVKGTFDVSAWGEVARLASVMLWVWLAFSVAVMFGGPK